MKAKVTNPSSDSVDPPKEKKVKEKKEKKAKVDEASPKEKVKKEKKSKVEANADQSSSALPHSKKRKLAIAPGSIEETAAITISASSSSALPHPNKRKLAIVPGSIEETAAITISASSSKSKSKRTKLSKAVSTDPTSTLFKGLTFAASTLDIETAFLKPHERSALTYKPPYNYLQLTALLKNNGANVLETISPKRLHSLITTDTARLAVTQKVKKCVNRNVTIIDVAWIEECILSKTLLDSAPYDVTLSSKTLVDKRSEKEKSSSSGVDVTILENENENEDGVVGWSEPVAYGCSCVCHENIGYDVVTDCEWCVDCSMNVELRKGGGGGIEGGEGGCASHTGTDFEGGVGEESKKAAKRNEEKKGEREKKEKKIKE